MNAQTDLQQSLAKCRIDGNILHLPPLTEPLPNYPELRKALLSAGAKYKRSTFVFPGPAKDYVDQLMGGTVNLRKEYQFFATPPELADELVRRSGVASLPGDGLILEPSAGQGAILDAIARVTDVVVDVCELMEMNQKLLRQRKNVDLVAADFLELKNHADYYDVVVANPPFSKNQDIRHIYKMYEVTKPGGTIVTVASTHWQLADNRLERDFRQWVESHAEVEPLPRGTFAESGTEVPACILTIRKFEGGFKGKFRPVFTEE